MNDPKIVVDSIVDAEGNSTKSGINAYPISIRRYAYLELIGSPFVDATVPFNVQTIIPSAFIFTHTNQELKKFKSTDAEAIKQEAYDWADSKLKLDDIPELIKSISMQMKALNKAAPEQVPDSGTSQDGTKKN